MKTAYCRGFTLVELVVTTMVTATLLSMAAPSFRGLVQDNRLVTRMNGFTSSMNMARSEAVRRSTPISLCKSSGLTSCDGVRWEDGWILFTDADGDGVVDAADNDTILQVHEALKDATFRGAQVRVTFDLRGYSSGFSGTWSLCDERGPGYARAAVLANTGRLRMAFDADGDGVVEDNGGNNVSCP